jgi:hypothetical protein
LNIEVGNFSPKKKLNLGVEAMALKETGEVILKHGCAEKSLT